MLLLWREIRRRRPLLRLLPVAMGGVWWWAVCRLVDEPGRADSVEGLVVTGGWGLSLLPVHCVPWSRGRRGGARRGEGWGGERGGGEADGGR
ncbi:hypothetical protein [Streptomyces huiliensis]|uniref:hypothetical protein n=1 Tax=Streptomyces huiliensis TaxID=2876027 RepID=UPI001CBB2B7D|nr:hypothetical protein [Streptomyces huiliensis]MBZ4323931.1 hypothetical protein [Streptomyces huiliensis]